LLKGVKLGDRTYKNHLDGYNQMDLITGKGPSKRHEIFYSAKAPSARYASTTTSSASSTSRTAGSVRRPRWTCPTSPTCASIRSSARLAQPRDEGRRAAVLRLVQVQFWRFVFVQEVWQGTPDLPRLPPMQRGASFNLDAVKAEMAKRMNRPSLRPKAPASNSNGPHGGRPVRAARFSIAKYEMKRSKWR
jgi:arylsulfatase